MHPRFYECFVLLNRDYNGKRSFGCIRQESSRQTFSDNSLNCFTRLHHPDASHNPLDIKYPSAQPSLSESRMASADLRKRQLPLSDGLTIMDLEFRQEVKKVRTEEPPSRVLHLRGLPAEISEKEVAQFAVPFGLLQSMLLTKNGNAFLEFQLQTSSTKMLEYYNTYNPPVIRGLGLLGVQYSKYTELNTTVSPNALEGVISANKLHATLSASETSRCVLLVHIEQAPTIPLGYVHFYKVFRPFGEILKIVTFKASNVPQALIEFADPIFADVAKLQADGCAFTAGGLCRTNYSRQSTLEVHQENQFCRDFTKNPFTHEPATDDPLQSTAIRRALNLPTMKELASLSADVLCVFANDVIQAMQFVAAGHTGPELPTMRNQIGLLRSTQPLLATGLSTGASVLGIDAPNRTVDLLRQLAPLVSTTTGTPVVIVSGLDPERTTPDILFTLFGVYGDVQRVKILYNKKNTALVQFTDARQADRAIFYLNGLPLFGGTLRVSHSKFPSINKSQNSQAGEDGGASEATDTSQDLTRDYAGSRLHRFRNANSRNAFNIYGPNTVLHVSGLPDDISEFELVQLFTQVSGHPISGVKMFPNEKKMALVEFRTIKDAIEGLIALDAYQIRPKCCMRVTFSKFPLKNAE
nr:unnamed protein product [Spirometra erinaceieuropaei]